MKKDKPYPVVYEDHDGSWTWSIEIGEPFEADHRVLATDYGYPDRREARSALDLAMQEVVATLAKEKQADLDQRQEALDQQSGRETAVPASAPEALLSEEQLLEATPSTAGPSTEMGGTLASSTLPDWAVFKKSKIIALFSTSKRAKLYASDGKGMTVKQIQISISLKPVS